MNSFNRLQDWYMQQCNGDWEHSFGIKIETLDNPGWHLTIDLQSTALENAEMALEDEKSELDWYVIKVANRKYEAFGDPGKLDFLIAYFLDDFLPKYEDPEFEYEVWLPVKGCSSLIWTEARAKKESASAFVITSIKTPDFKQILAKQVEDITFSEKELEQFSVPTKVGDIIKVKLIETFQGVRLGKFEE